MTRTIEAELIDNGKDTGLEPRNVEAIRALNMRLHKPKLSVHLQCFQSPWQDKTKMLTCIQVPGKYVYLVIAQPSK
jgi:hypothetical protein